MRFLFRGFMVFFGVTVGKFRFRGKKECINDIFEDFRFLGF